MTIDLFDDYFVVIDEYCYALKQKYMGENKKGEPTQYEKIIGYYSNMNFLLKGLLRMKLVDENEQKYLSIKEYVDYEESILEKIMNLEIVRKG